MKNKYVEIYSKLAIALISLFGILINFKLFGSWKGILYYTILSNLFVLIMYSYSFYMEIRKKKYKTNRYYYLKGLSLLLIVSTMIVYNLFLSGNSLVYKNHDLESIIVHVVVPVLTILESILFNSKKTLENKYMIGWVLTIFVYFCFTVIYSVLGGTFLNNVSYPYAIFDYHKLSTLRLGFNSVSMLVGYAFLGVVILFINKNKK